MLDTKRQIGLVEVSVPPYAALRIPYLFYLGKIVPIFGKGLLGNPENYRMLGRYVAAFGNCRLLEAIFSAPGCEIRRYSFFGGCATALVGGHEGTEGVSCVIRPTDERRFQRYFFFRFSGALFCPGF